MLDTITKRQLNYGDGLERFRDKGRLTFLFLLFLSIDYRALHLTKIHGKLLLKTNDVKAPELPFHFSLKVDLLAIDLFFQLHSLIINLKCKQAGIDRLKFSFDES